MAPLLLRHLAVICLHFLLLHGAVVRADSVEDFHVVNDPDLNDVTYTTHILFPFSSVRSRLDCLRLCASAEDCKAVTYVRGSGSCQGHSVTRTSEDPRVGSPGARTFNFRSLGIPEWIGDTPCYSDGDCLQRIPEAEQFTSAQLPICYKQRCLCRPGYFYSLGQRLCVQSCPDTDLQLSFTMKYPVSGVNDFNHYTFHGDAEYCTQKCAEQIDCKNVEVNDAKLKCHGSKVSGKNFVNNDVGWDLYQRDCA